LCYSQDPQPEGKDPSSSSYPFLRKACLRDYFGLV
jgi:hypothetical protein